MIKLNIPHSDRKRVVIIGAGFAGLQLAKSLRKLNYQVVLIDKNNYHQFQPLFYQVATAGLEPSSIVFPLRKMFQERDDFYIRVTSVDSVEPENKVIRTPLGYLRYDYLVISTGAETNFFGNEKIAEHAIPMKSVSEALYLRNHIFEDYEKALTSIDFEERQAYIDVVIVGGGPTGVELAGALAEMRRHILPKDYKEIDTNEVEIFLIQSGDMLLKGMSEKAGKAAEKYLKDLGVQVKLNARVLDYDGKFVTMNDGTTIRTKKVIWAAGIVGNKMKGIPDDCLTKGARIIVDKYNTVKNFKDIFALGDVAYMETEDFPQGHPQVAQVALQQAKNLGNNFNRIAKNQELIPFQYKDLGSMATVGRNLAVADLPKMQIKGFWAWVLWLFVHLFALVGFKNKVFVFLNWVWNYFTYDQSLRLIIRPRVKPSEISDFIKK